MTLIKTGMQCMEKEQVFVICNDYNKIEIELKRQCLSY